MAKAVFLQLQPPRARPAWIPSVPGTGAEPFAVSCSSVPKVSWPQTSSPIRPFLLPPFWQGRLSSQSRASWLELSLRQRASSQALFSQRLFLRQAVFSQALSSLAPFPQRERPKRHSPARRPSSRVLSGYPWSSSSLPSWTLSRPFRSGERLPVSAPQSCIILSMTRRSSFVKHDFENTLSVQADT